jgi:hypothetical protein
LPRIGKTGFDTSSLPHPPVLFKNTMEGSRMVIHICSPTKVEDHLSLSLRLAWATQTLSEKQLRKKKKGRGRGEP